LIRPLVRQDYNSFAIEALHNMGQRKKCLNDLAGGGERISQVVPLAVGFSPVVHRICGPLDEFEAVELAALLTSMALEMTPSKPPVH
jgi:hypothetical protein